MVRFKLTESPFLHSLQAMNSRVWRKKEEEFIEKMPSGSAEETCTYVYYYV